MVTGPVCDSRTFHGSRSGFTPRCAARASRGFEKPTCRRISGICVFAGIRPSNGSGEITRIAALKNKHRIIDRNVLDLLGDVRKKFEIGHDVLRHTFISMHVAKFRSMGDTALQAGNSEHMIKKHYLNRVTPPEAKQFWNVMSTAANGQALVPTETELESVSAVEEKQAKYGAAACVSLAVNSARECPPCTPAYMTVN